ncbi:DUF1833 family protein [Fuscovulum blasticum]|uniref:DUF1833 family protein n=1 Tax=Fuscovulum blasticum TaxID=1075 RepID=UPI000D3E77F1|nr:DUF1833 family protein [Fuscovulum blasticum]AWD21621.1 hypothetical protein B6K69_07975 [Fuscovulum blasticum]
MTDRDISPAARLALESVASTDALLPFVLVEHPALAQPIRVVSDVIDYQMDGHLWLGLLFRVSLPTDTDGPPEASITIPNVDRRIGTALRVLTDRAYVTLSVLSSADFDLSQDPRVAPGPVTPVYPAMRFVLVDIECNVSQLSGTLMLRDYTQEPWPRLFATESRLPALFK